MAVGRLEPLDQAPAGAVHGETVEVARAVQGGDDHHLRPVGLRQALGQGLAHDQGGEVLVLEIDRPLGPGDGLQVQGLGLAHLGAVAPVRLGAGDGDAGSGEAGRHERRPGIAGDALAFGRRRQGHALLGRAPALAGEVAERPGGLAVDHHHHLVARGVLQAARHDPAAVRVEVGGGIPAVHAEIAAAAEGEAVVDHQHLLVMAGAEGHAGVEREVDPRALEPLARAVREEVLGGRDRQGRLPDQDVDVELGPLVRQAAQQIADLVGPVLLARRVGPKARARVEAPAEQEDRAPRPAHGRQGGGEIGAGIDQQGDAVGGLHAPAGLSGMQKAGS